MSKNKRIAQLKHDNKVLSAQLEIIIILHVPPEQQLGRMLMSRDLDMLRLAIDEVKLKNKSNLKS